MNTVKKSTRTYKLRLYPNTSKLDTARYTNAKYLEYVNMWSGRLFFNPKGRVVTKGTGGLSNQAQNRARGIINALFALQKSTRCKINVPVTKHIGSPAKIVESKNSSFDYWVSVSNQWTKVGMVKLPAKSHKALNNALKTGWKLNPNCEFKVVDGVPYTYVFVQKATPRTLKPKTMLGIDVGMKHSVTSSEGYLGRGLSTVIKKQKQRQAERRRQGHKVSSKVRTEVKQILDIEAKAMLRRSKHTGAGISVEDPKHLANLKTGKLHGWARSYFANRIHILGKEEGVLVLDVDPYKTSQTCSSCGSVDKESRVTRDLFICTSCGFNLHADINAARTVALKGTQILNEKLKRFRS